MTLVESPTFALFTMWMRSKPAHMQDQFKYILHEVQLDSYHGEVVVLNGGSMDARVRNRVAHLAACAELRVVRMEV